MSDDVQEALRIETEYLAGVESNLDEARVSVVGGSHYRMSRHDELDRLRRIMLEHQSYDHQRMLKLPRNRRIALHGFERRWWFLPSRLARIKAFRRKTGVAIASVLAPLAHYVTRKGESAGTPPPVSSVELMRHVRGLLTDPEVPHLIGVCSPTGFTSDARNAALDLPNVTLVLTEPRADGGWNTHAVGEEAPEAVCRLFDPEEVSQKIQRATAEIERRAADLLSGGLSADSVAEPLGLPTEVVAEAFRRKTISDPELRISSQSGTMVLYQGGTATMQEKPRKSILDHIRELFNREGDEAEKIEKFSEQRAMLAQRRDRLYGQIGKLEDKEAELLEQGRKNPSKVVRRRLAAQLVQVRKDIARQNTLANQLNQQINIIATRIHNLTLIQNGQMAQLPSTEELAEEAVQAEEMLEQLKADADMVASLETTMSDTLADQEELEVLKEFDEPASTAPSRAQAAPPVSTPPETAAAEPAAPEAEPSPWDEGEPESKDKGTPEAN
ncbi:MAG: hypothetical protein JSU68_08680 [Phycisphaerales bacterium]|nr:MAG: hypothetical protein JSU68_08680 [Phycisphaerales bacterium]